MIGRDTNVVVRYLVQDDPTQAGQAAAFIEGRLSTDNPGFIARRVDRDRVGAAQLLPDRSRTIGRTLRALLEVRCVWVERTDLVVRALRRSADSGADFSDALIVELTLDHGCSEMVSFDASAKGLCMRML